MQKFSDFDVGLICYAISTTEGSEPGAGWLIAKSYLEIASKLTIYTRRENAQDLATYIEKHKTEICIEVVEFSKSLNAILKLFPVQIAYHLWNFKVYLKLRSKFVHNLIHHATYAGDWNITALHLLRARTPSILGPVGGAQQIPLKLRTELSFRNKIKNKAHELFGNMMRRISRQILKRKKTILIAANQSTADFFQILNPIVLQNIGFNLSQVQAKYPDSKIFFGAGRLLYWKNWELPIKSMLYLRDFKLKIAGSGPEHIRLQKLIEDLDLIDQVELLGKIEKAEVLHLISQSRALVFPSLRDSASWNLAEAMHLSIPVVALDVPGNEILLQKFNLPLVKSVEVNPQVYARAMIETTQSAPFSCFCECIFKRKLQNVVQELHSRLKV